MANVISKIKGTVKNWWVFLIVGILLIIGSVWIFRTPIESFINSGFFSKDISRLWLRGDLVNLLADNHIKGIVMLTILKGIDDYFARIDISESYKERPVEQTSGTGERRLSFSKSLNKETTDSHDDQ